MPAVAELARSIVRVGRGPQGGGSCGGVLIAPASVLTAGHCTVDRRQWSEAGLRDLTVWLGGRPLEVTDVRLAPVSPFGPKGAILDLGNDWAVLTVVVPPELHARPLPYLGTPAARLAYATEAPLLKAGFEQEGRTYRLSLTPGCLVLAAAPAGSSLQFACGEGLGEGVSGSALLAAHAGGWGVVGLMSGKREGGGRETGIAVVPPLDAVRPR